MKKLFSIVAALMFVGSLVAAEYEKAAFADISATDEVIITAEVSDVVYALVNADASSTKPAAEIVTVVSDAIETDATNLQWNIVEVEDSLVLYPAGQTEKWLSYSKSSNNLRVKSDNKLFGFEYTTDGYLKVKCPTFADSDGLYVALNQAKDAWGHYKNGVVITFFKKAGGATALENTVVENCAVKRIVNGQVIIERDGVRYNVIGQVIK